MTNCLRTSLCWLALALLPPAVWGERPSEPRKPVQILVFTDFECPYCRDLGPKLSKIAHDYSAQVRITLKQNPLSFHAHSRLAHAAELAAGEQGKAWEMHDLLFANQTKLEKVNLLGFARELGLGLPQFERDLASTRLNDIIESDLAEGQALGVTGTPTLFINGQKLVGTQSFDSLVSSIKQAAGELQPTAQPAPREPLQISSAGAFAKGADDAHALITIVNFSDIQCPFCARENPVLEKIVNENPNKVRLVYKHFPLGFHQQALPAAEAAEAAGSQGKFWEMYDLLVTNQGSLGEQSFERFARELGLDMGRFTADLSSHKFLSKIQADRAEGVRLGVSGTPTFFVNGRILDGARPEAEFRSVVKAEFARLKVPVELESSEPSQVLANSEVSRGTEFSKGALGSPVKIQWYSDVQSPLANAANQIVTELMRLYPDRVQVVFRHRPLENRPQSLLAHEALLAAGAQGKFWQMHDLLLANQNISTQGDLERLAIRLRLDQKAFLKDLTEHVYLPVIQKDLEVARRAEIRGTPVFFVNGSRIDGIQPIRTLLEYFPESVKLTSAKETTDFGAKAR